MTYCTVETQADEKFCAGCGLRWAVGEDKPQCPRLRREKPTQPTQPAPLLKLCSVGRCSSKGCKVGARYVVADEQLCFDHAKASVWRLALGNYLQLKTILEEKDDRM